MLEFPIYLDHSATTPVAPEVLEAMMPYFGNKFGNSATIYTAGAEARSAVDESRESIADIISAQPEEIYFTSGGTEADNWALQGAARSSKHHRHILISAIEHHAVLDSALSLRDFGFEIELVQPDSEGIIDPREVEARIRENTLLVSVMHANNEMGAIQDISAIANVCKQRNVLFHVDAVQTFARLRIDLQRTPIDLLTMSAHKIYGPKGIGALYIRRGTAISPWHIGGGQEAGRRAGTLNVPGIVGFATSARRSQEKFKIEQERQTLLSNYFIDTVLGNIEGVRLTGSRSHRLAGNVHLTIAGVEGESLLLALDMSGIYASAGSACTTGSTEPSHVLLAMGMSVEQARGGLRLTLGESTTMESLRYVADRLKIVVQELRALS